MPGLTPREVHEVLARVFSDPHRMVDAIANAEDPAGAVDALSEAFGLTQDQAALVLDQQLVHLTRSKLAVLKAAPSS
jgi:DNA gyrase/topoisomerase IV subunit A